ncbi:DUF934 domain-containing protein [Candidatus Njordibacter sp. Uisw_002]|jgi:uncharacterized protein (DUF934 family)|uniref:DUF934 domain-containing protein n=1 Tax=Candidatus Njordibacter sp. Uisw_002 TaxID=3230971 RepID=UPI003D4900BD
MALIKDQQLSISHVATPDIRFADWLDDDLIKGESVLTNGADDLTCLLANASKLDMIAIEFETFADGRGFSMARLLRREGYQGEIRAVGDVAMDRIEFMHRVGFNAFELRDDQNVNEALTKLSEMSVHFQPSADGKGPAYMA